MKLFIKSSNKKGMLVLVLAAAVIFLFVVFGAIINRLRSEALLTNRVSVNERLNQIAFAAGKFAIRKIHRSIEEREESFEEEGIGHALKMPGLKILNNFFDVDPSEKLIYDSENDREINLSESITSIKVMRELKDEFDKTFHGKLDPFKICCIVERKNDENDKLNPKQLETDDGGFVLDNKYECKGTVKVKVTVGIDNVIKREYTISKDFLFTRLLAAPFYRYNLFSHHGAEILPNIANIGIYDKEGQTDKKPLVCLNERRTLSFVGNNDSVVTSLAKDENHDHFKNGYSTFTNSDNIIKSGWIYLGGQGKFSSGSNFSDMEKNNQLLLNISYGDEDKDAESSFLENYFGEGFHFYENVLKWKVNDNFDNLINNNPTFKDKVRMGSLKMGFCKDYESAEARNGMLFFGDTFFGNYKNAVGGGTAQGDFLLEKKFTGSSMHLYGTPHRCYPTLVFGPVHRRYLHLNEIEFFPPEDKNDACSGNSTCFFQFPTLEHNDELDVKYILNLLSDPNPRDENKSVYGVKNYFGLRYYSDSLKHISFSDSGEKLANDVVETLKKYIDINEYYSASDGLAPRVSDEEPYNYSLRDICTSEVMSDFYDKFIEEDKFKDLCKPDFVFKDKQIQESMYSGDISSIKIIYDYEDSSDDKRPYLSDRTTYTLDASEEQEISIKDNVFINKMFFDEPKDSNNDDKVRLFHLNQIIRINGNLNIDETLYVRQGGIIICNGRTTITKPIVNIYNHPDNEKFKELCNNEQQFGYLTIISKNGIEIKELAPLGNNKNPTIEAFLVAGCGKDNSNDGKITLAPNLRVHFIGGVAADDISDLVNNGCILEWGFQCPLEDKEEGDKVTDYKEKSFYGCTLGPRDIELYTSGS